MPSSSQDQQHVVDRGGRGAFHKSNGIHDPPSFYAAHTHTSTIHPSIHPQTYTLRTNANKQHNADTCFRESRPSEGILVLTLDRPRKKNAITGAMYLDVRSAMGCAGCVGGSFRPVDRSTRTHTRLPARLMSQHFNTISTAGRGHRPRRRRRGRDLPGADGHGGLLLLRGGLDGRLVEPRYVRGWI